MPALGVPGQAVVKDPFKPLAAKLAALLDKETGRIRVVGHTDNTPIKNVRFPSGRGVVPTWPPR